MNERRKRKADDMLVSFENYPPERRWEQCLGALMNDYTLSFRRACEILMCNRSWVQKYVRPHVHYIYLSNGIRNEKQFRANYVKIAEMAIQEMVGDDTIALNESVWLNATEFEKVIKDNMMCTRQTIRVPLELLIKKNCLTEFRGEYSRITDQIESEFRKYTGIDLNKIRKLQDDLDRLVSDSLTSLGKAEFYKKANKYKRSEIEAIPCDPRQYGLDELTAVHDAKGYGGTDEEIYRRLFADGYYRLELNLTDTEGVVSKKVYYLEPDQAEKKMLMKKIGIAGSVKFIAMGYSRFLEFIKKEKQYQIAEEWRW